MNRTAKTAFGAMGLVALTAGGGHAQQAAPGQTAQAAAGLEEIIVTARRREEQLQSVPVAITAFTPERLREQHITTNADLGKLVPSFQVRDVTRGFSNGPGSQQAFIRGLPGVATYFAEVPTSITGPTNFFDLANVQALTGPQGTLFGLNATGGAILVEPQRPTNKFEGYVEGTFGNHSWKAVEGAINIPVVDDKLMVRLAGKRDVRDGYTTVVETGEKLDNDDYWTWRAGVTFRPSDSIENYLVYTGSFLDTRQASSIMQGVNLRSTPAFIVGAATLQAALANQQRLGQRRVQALSVDDNNQERKMQVVDIFQWHLTDTLLFKNIAGYRRFGGLSRYDSDGTALGLFGASNEGIATAFPDYWRSYTEEAQLQGTGLDGKLTWVAGGFLQYNDQEFRGVHPAARSYAVGLLIPGQDSYDDGTQTNPNGRTQALFASATYDLGGVSDSLDGLRFTGGFRYNWDYRSTLRYSRAASGACSSSFADANCIQQLGGKFKAPGWTVTVDYQVTPDAMVYVTNRRGYSSGNFNPTAPTADLQTVDPEYNTDIEVGAKADWNLGNGMAARTNIALFKEWYDNVQRVASLVYTDATGRPTTIALNLNAAKADIKGLEFQGLLRLSDQVELQAYYQYLHAKFLKFQSVDSAGNPLDLSGQPFGDAPKHRYSVTGRYHLPMDEAMGRISLSATYTWRSKVFVEAGFGTPFPGRPSYGLLDLRADWNDIFGYPVDLSFFMTNVTNKLYALGDFPVWNSLGFHAEIWGEPRMFAAQLRYRFGG
jgi:iron complex outermembrane receptor protein